MADIPVTSLSPRSIDISSMNFMMVWSGNSPWLLGWDIFGTTPLRAVRSITLAANKLPYGTHADSLGLADFTSSGRSIVAVANMSSLVGLQGLTGVWSYSFGTTAQWNARASSLGLQSDQIFASQIEVAITDAASVTMVLSTGPNFVWTLGGANRSLVNPANTSSFVGQKGRFRWVQSGASACSMSFDTFFKFTNSTPFTLPVGSGDQAIGYYDVIQSGYISMMLGAWDWGV